MNNLQEILTTRAGLSKDVAESLTELANLLAERPQARITAFIAAAQIEDTDEDGDKIEAVVVSAHGNDKDTASLLKKLDFNFFQAQLEAQRQGNGPQVTAIRMDQDDIPDGFREFLQALAAQARARATAPCTCAKCEAMRANGTAAVKVDSTPATGPTE
jgi:hypothetical protein